MKESMSNLEQETIITFNRAEDQAEVYTHEPSLKRRLDKLCKNHPDSFKKMEANSWGGNTYVMPKDLISIRQPVSDERRQAARERSLKAGSYWGKSADPNPLSEQGEVSGGILASTGD